MDGPKTLAAYIEILGGRTLHPLSSRSAAFDRIAAHAYLNRMEPLWLEDVMRLSGSLPPLNPMTRAVTLIPARNEEYRIASCLSAIDIDIRTSAAEEWSEILVLENGFKGELGRTKASIFAWAKAHRPRYAVNVISKEWTANERNPLAKARKLLADVTIARSLSANLVAPLYLLSEDADIEHIECGRLTAAVRCLNVDPSIDALRGFQDRTVRALKANHLALLERRSWQMTEALLSASSMWPENNPVANFYWNRVVTAGSNVFIPAQVYCEIDGYSTDVVVFEDMDIGQRISVLRGCRNGSRFIPRVSSIRRAPFREESNIARILHALSHAAHVYEHNGANFYRIDQAIKRADAVDVYLAELVEFATVCSANKQRYESVLADLWREVSRIVVCKDAAERIMLRVLYYLGFRRDDCTMLKGDIAVKDWSRFAHLAHQFSADTGFSRHLRRAPASVRGVAEMRGSCT